MEIKWKKPIQQLINQDILGKETMEYAARAAEEIMRPFVPMDTGNLESKVNIIAGETISAVHYTAPYAAPVYYNSKGVTFKKGKHPLASKEWDRAAMGAGGKDRLAAAVSAHIKGKRV